MKDAGDKNGVLGLDSPAFDLSFLSINQSINDERKSIEIMLKPLSLPNHRGRSGAYTARRSER